MNAYEPDLLEIQALVDEHYITCRKHRTADLFIYNYTPKTQYSRFWNEHTRACRGLILDGRGNIVARPFEKFFNIGEGDTAWLNESFEVYEKLDGSLGILYFGPNGPALATRGSFQSEQAIVGTQILRERYASALPNLDPMLTYLFEIIFPENRIVVDYGDQRDIVLLAVLDTLSGEDLSLSTFERLGFPIVKRYDGFTREMLELGQIEEGTNREGFVVRFASGVRAKVKISEYVRIQRLVTGVTPRRIWERLSTGEDIMPLVAQCPAAYQQWVHQQADRLLAEYAAIEKSCETFYAGRPAAGDRKANALYFAEHPHRAVMFRMLDGRPYDDVIWKAIYPQAADPFKVEV